MKTIIVTLLLMVAAAEQATAANILVTNETTIYIGGELLVGDDARFQNALTPEIRRINLASNGGALNTALRIGQLVRERKLETVVYNGAQCASACALIWLAGSKRYLNQGARIGLHGAWIKETWEPAAAGDIKQQAFMRALRDVPEALIMMPLSTPWWTMRWIEYDEAAGFRLVVPPIELPEVPAIKPPEFPTIKLPIKLPIEFPTIKPPELPVTNPQQWREAEDELWKLPAIKPPPICHWLCVIGRFLALKRVVAVP